MKRNVSLFIALTAAFVIMATQLAFVQDKAPVKVTGSQVVTGVVIVHVQKDKKTLDLQCNQGVSSCKALQSGSYLMLELPPNYGMYDCKNVEMYQGDPDKPDDAEKVGSYCLVEK
jgi:hypothetical protein